MDDILYVNSREAPSIYTYVRAYIVIISLFLAYFSLPLVDPGGIIAGGGSYDSQYYADLQDYADLWEKHSPDHTRTDYGKIVGTTQTTRPCQPVLNATCCDALFFQRTFFLSRPRAL